MHVGKIREPKTTFKSYVNVFEIFVHLYLDIVVFVLRPHLALSRSQSSLFHGSMRTLFGYMIP